MHDSASKPYKPKTAGCFEPDMFSAAVSFWTRIMRQTLEGESGLAVCPAVMLASALLASFAAGEARARTARPTQRPEPHDLLDRRATGRKFRDSEKVGQRSAARSAFAARMASARKLSTERSSKARAGASTICWLRPASVCTYGLGVAFGQPVVASKASASSALIAAQIWSKLR